MQSLLLLAGLLPAAPVAAPPAPRAFIVIAGINSYADREIPSRPHPEDDARALHDLLSDRRYLGAGKDQMRLLLGKSATRRALLESMEWLRDRAGRDDLVLFAFFGQGATIDERGERKCYLAADSSLAGRAHDAISAGDFAEVFDRMRSRRVCVILDVNFAGFRTKRTVAQPLRSHVDYRDNVVFPDYQLDFPEFSGDDCHHQRGPSPGRLVLAREDRFPDVLAGMRGEADAGEAVVTSLGLAAFLKKRLDRKRPSLRIIQGDGPDYPLVLNPAVCRKPVKLAPLPREQAEKYAEKVLDLCEAVHEEHYLQPDVARLLDLGIRGLYDRIRQPVPEEIPRRLKQVKGLNKESRKELLADVRQRLGKRPDLVNESDVLWTMQELLKPIDEWSGCVRDDRIFICGGVRAGIGLALRKNAATNFLEVVTPICNGPAHKAGVKAGDVITVISRVTDAAGNPLPVPEEFSTRDRSREECVDRILGKPGTPVILTVERAGKKRPLDIQVTRARQDWETVHGRRRKDDGSWEYSLDSEKKIAYIRISQFARFTTKEMETVVERLQKDGTKGLILDLRCCPGGLLTSARAVAGLFLKEGVVVTVQGTGGKREVLKVEPGKTRYDGPLVVLINKETMMGAEMVAACLQDHKRAVIAGERSFGKASVQNIVPGGLNELRLTVGVFYRPNGQTWMTWQDGEAGVTPDKGFEMQSSRQEREELDDRMRASEYLPPPVPADFKDVQLQKALEHLRR